LGISTNILHAFIMSYACYITRASYPPGFDEVTTMFTLCRWNLLHLLLHNNAFFNVAGMGKSGANLTVDCNLHYHRNEYFCILLVWKRTE
jgi:hypothetical protein